MYTPDDNQLKIAIRYGEKLRESMIGVEAFDAAAAMRDLLALAYNEQQARENLATHKKAD